MHVDRVAVAQNRRLKLETVSRALSALSTAGFIQVDHRTIDIVDADALRGVIDPTGGIPASIAPPPAPIAAKRSANSGKRERKQQSQFRHGLAWRQLAAA